MLLGLSSTSPFIPSISPLLRLRSRKLLRDLQVQSLWKPKTPFLPPGPLPTRFRFPNTLQRASTNQPSLFQLPKSTPHPGAQLHTQVGDSTVDGTSEQKASILSGTGGGGSGGSLMAMKASDGEYVNLEADGNGVVSGGVVINSVGDASSNSGNPFGGRAARIREKLERGLRPVALEVEDISYQHAGHAAVRGNSNGETHFNVKVISNEFEGKNLVKRHRLVYDLLQDELQSGLHALSIVAKTPSEVGTK